MERLSTVTARLMRQLTLARHCPRVKIIEGKSEGGAHRDRPEILDQMRDQKGRGVSLAQSDLYSDHGVASQKVRERPTVVKAGMRSSSSTENATNESPNSTNSHESLAS